MDTNFMIDEVIAIENVECNSLRYDITVKDNHNFFANGILVHNCQNLVKDIFETHKGETYEVTIKLDGSSMTVYYNEGEIGVCSRNIDLKESETNTFWKVARESNIIDALTEYCKFRNKNIALQGEIVGEGIQGNPEKIEGNKFYLFDVYDIDEQRYLKPYQRQKFLFDVWSVTGITIKHVPIIDKEIAADAFVNIDSILEAAEGQSLNPDTKREGIVFKSHNSDFSFKAISNSYLLKKK